MPAVPIGEILVRREHIDPNALRRAIAEQASRGQRLVSMLITQALIELDDGALALSEQLDYPAVLERDFEARSPKLATLITPEAGRAWAVIPLAKTPDGTLVVAARDPSPALAAAIREAVGMPVILAVGPAIYIERIVRAVYKGPAETKPPELPPAPADEPAPTGWSRRTVRELIEGPVLPSLAAGPIAIPRTQPRTIAAPAAPAEVFEKERSSRNEAPTQPPPLGRTAQSFDAPDDTRSDPPKPRTTTSDPAKPRTTTANRIARDQIKTKPPAPGYDPQAFDSGEAPVKPRTSSSGQFAGTARITTRNSDDTKPPPLGRTAASYDDPAATNLGLPETRPPAPPRTSTSAALANSPLITSRPAAPTNPPLTVRTEDPFETETATDTRMLPALLRPPAPPAELVAQPMISTASTAAITPPSSRSITRDIEKALSKQTAEKLVIKHLAHHWRSVLIVAVAGEVARAVRGHGERLQVIDRLSLAVSACSLLRLARDTASITMTTSQGNDVDPLLDLVGLPASAAPVIVEQERTVAIVAAGEPIDDLAAGMQEISAMAAALAGAYRRFK